MAPTWADPGLLVECRGGGVGVIWVVQQQGNLRRPPTLSFLSKTETQCPAWLSCAAAASPAGPLPTTATRLPVRKGGGCGDTSPFSKAVSTIVFSMFLMFTGGALMPNTHAPSHGAGHTLPATYNTLIYTKNKTPAVHRDIFRLFSNLRLLLSITQYCSDITSKINADIAQ